MAKQNFFRRIINGLKHAFLFINYNILYFIIKLFSRSKVVGKQNINANDTGRVFITNHYEIYGPMIMFMRFPYKFRPWVIDKMTNPETVEQQMSISIYENFPKYPKWFKKIAIKTLKTLMVYTMNVKVKAISVSRDNPRANIKTMQESTESLESGIDIMIQPELRAVKEGVGEFQTGFEYIAKYYHQKTGKSLTFYPIFISKKYKTIYVEKPITFNSENEPNEEKQRITTYLHDTMVQSYLDNEVNRPSKKAR